MDGRAIAGLILSLATLVAGVVAVAINKWYVEEQLRKDNVMRYIGLWEKCTWHVGETTQTCEKWSSGERWIHGCQALMIIGVGGVAIAMVLIILKRVPNKWAAVCLSIAEYWLGSKYSGLCLVTAAIVFGAKVTRNSSNSEKKNSHLDAGFGLAIAAGVTGIIAAIVEALSEEMTPYRRF